MRYRSEILLALLLVLLAGAGLLLWRGASDFSDFGLNFASEMVGALVTVFVVDLLIKQRDARRLLPFRLVAYQEMARLLNDYLTLFFQLYEQSVPEPAPATTADFLRQRQANHALYSCDLSKLPAVSPPQTLASWLAEHARFNQRAAEKFIEKFSLLTEPQPISLIYQIFLDAPLLPSLAKLEAYTRSVGSYADDEDDDETAEMTQATPLAEHIFVPDDSYWLRVLELHEWLCAERRHLLTVEKNLRQLVTPPIFKSKAARPLRLPERLRRVTSD